MPTYEYRCEACGNEWELEQRITADAIRECPKCGKPEAKRLVGTGNFILKGGGWYADLYSSTPKKKPGGDGESKSDSKGGSKPDATAKSSDTKSDSTAKTKPEKKASSKD